MPNVPKPNFTVEPTPMGEVNKCPVVLQSTLISQVLKSLQYKFSTPENIYHMELKSLLWTKDDDTSRILIIPSLKTARGTTNADVFPRVVLSSTGFKVNETSRRSIRNNSSLTGNGVHVGTNHYIEIDGALVITVVSRGDYEALLLAEDIFMWLVPLEEVIAKDLTLSSFEISVVNGPTVSEQYKDCYVASMGVSWRSGMGWRTVPDGPAFADVVVHQHRIE